MSLPQPGLLVDLAATAIKNAYDTVNGTTASAAQQLARAGRLRFWVHVDTAAGSSLTTVNVKLQHRWNDGTFVGGWVDLPSTLDDVQGSAQPKGSTFEIEHAFTVAANGSYDFSFYLDRPDATHDIRVQTKANAAGITNDRLRVFCQRG